MIKKIVEFLFGGKEKAEDNQHQSTTNTNEKVKPKKSLSQFKKSQILKDFIQAEQKKVLMLKPHFSAVKLDVNNSKMGGDPNLTNFESYPTCSDCNNKLNFILQIYKSEYPSFYFPTNRDLFQLFRCPNMDCKGIDYMKSDLKMYSYYFKQGDNDFDTKIEYNEIGELEGPIAECKFYPIPSIDFPNYDETESDIYSILETEYDEDTENFMFENYSGKIGTKIGGYPAWTQSPIYPSCKKCGKVKDFIFQLSSEEEEDVIDTETKENWSPHGLMMGDVGNIYYFACKTCGDEALESNWDCS
ncbi:MAG: DUF1963 domain-containing protein [Saprospiraceae bacterium]|nr:DUF1963 domain-containing protein [Saprospiraceae bacterium]